MCGIFGYLGRNGARLSAATLQDISKTLRHRGPDDAGVFAGDGVAIGNTRLSIIDIAGGHQPFVSDDGNIVVVQNGEIFNHVELSDELAARGIVCRTRSDTEVLLRLYEAEGIEFISRLNGMFAIAIYDRLRDEVFLVRDRIGVKPLYFAESGVGCIFGSEIKSILAAGVTPRPLATAIDLYLAYNYVPPPFTAFEGIRHVMPGHYLRVTRTATYEHRWWRLADVAPVADLSEARWIEEFNAILVDAVRLRLRADVPVGAFLSGGVDSSSVVGIMARLASQPVRTFCIGFEDPKYDESPFAAAAAARFGTHHTMERVDPNMLDLWPTVTFHCDQPHGDVSFMPTYRLSQLAANHVKLVLTGDGGDELFAGYDKYRDFFADPATAQVSEAEFRERYFRSISLMSGELRSQLYHRDFRSQLHGPAAFDVARPYFDESRHFDRINQALYLDMQLLLSGNNLVKPDRMGMAVSLEARTPFLDYRMMEFAFRMPGSLKLKGGETKYLYKKAVEPLIGRDLAYRRKQMFTVPVGEWFKRDLAAFCRERLGSPNGLFEQMITPAPVLKMLDEHVAGKSNWTRELRALLALRLWTDTFFGPAAVLKPAA
jgi:asparagine synthase (glutamine-hydrolysing)